MATQILLIDDHTLFREALVHVLENLDREVTVRHAGTASEAVAAVSYYRGLDLILLDRSLAGSDGISIIPQLRDRVGEVPVVILSGSGGVTDVRRALDAGAASYIPKTVGTNELLFGLQKVLQGESYLPAALLVTMEPVNNKTTASAQIKLDKLTGRQQEVLLLLSQGLSNKGIASHLNLCEGTVKLHVSAIMRTVGARNRTEAVVMSNLPDIPDRCIPQ